MKEEIYNFIDNLCLPKGISSFLTPHANIKVYNRNNFEHIKTKKRVLLIGSGFDNEKESNELESILKLGNEIAFELAKHDDLVIMSGCCSDFSVPSIVIDQLKKINPSYPTFGISRYEKLPLTLKYTKLSKLHDVILYSGHTKLNLPKKYEFAIADLVHVMMADYVISIHGSTGTNHELSVAYELQKPVGFITGYGGVTDIHPKVVASINTEGRKSIKAMSHKNPKKVIDWLLSQ